MKKRLPLLLFPVLALILEALPYGAVLQFARPAAAPLRELYSYFDLTPFGYANFAPLFTALGTCPAGPAGAVRRDRKAGTCRRSVDRSGRLRPRLARSAPAGHPELFRYRCAHHGLPAGGMSLAVPRMETEERKPLKRPAGDEENQTSPLCQCGEGGLLCAMERIQ